MLLTASEFYAQQAISCDLLTLSKLTFNKSPTLKTGQLRIKTAEGNLQVQRSTFDYQLFSRASLSKNTLHTFDADPRNEFVGSSIKTNTTEISLGIERTFRTGQLASISMNYGNVFDNFPFNSFNQNVGAGIADQTVATTFSLTQPLLKGRGSKIVTALEKAATLGVESNEKNYDFANSLEVLQMGIAYWNYVTAYKSFGVFEENENRVRNVLRITGELVKADKKPAGDLIQIQADLANQERQTQSALQNLHNARINLGRVIGIDEQESLLLGVPKNDFPSIAASRIDDTTTIDFMKTLAKENRRDLRSFEKVEEALQLQVALAKNNLTPQLDLTGFASYGGMYMGNRINNALSSLGQREGRNYEVGLRLNFSFPLNNNLAKGSFLRDKTALSEQQVLLDNLQRNVDMDVDIALNNLKNSVGILEKAKETLGYYKDVFDNEQLKFQNGLTTLLNLILFQERLTFAQLEYLNAQQQFAVAIIELRHQTGTLIATGSKDKFYEISEQAYYVVPGL